MKTDFFWYCLVICIFTQYIGFVVSFENFYDSSENEESDEIQEASDGIPEVSDGIPEASDGIPEYTSISFMNTTEIKDLMIAYRLSNENSSAVIKEIYRWGNALNILLKTSDGRYLDQTEGIVSLGCTLATEDCKWKSSPEWGYTNWRVTEEDHFTINVDDNSPKENDCAQRNGGCEIFCKMVNEKVKCSCPYGYIMEKEDLCKFEGRFVNRITKSDTYRGYKDYHEKWLIIPSTGSTIHMVVSSNRNYNGFPRVDLREIVNNTFSYTKSFSEKISYQKARVESNSILELTTYSYTSIEVDFMRKLLTLQGNHGWLTYDIIPKAGCICACLVYTSPVQNEKIELTAQFINGTISEIEKFTERQFNKWRVRCSKQLLPEYFEESVKLKFSVAGRGITLHSIYGCGNQDVYVTRTSASFPEIKYYENPKKSEENTTRHCYNEGRFNAVTQKCVCPEGYMGDSCEDACSPYNFGQNCSAECSPYTWGCRGIIFCKDGLPCFCAPGYTGRKCDQICDRNFYGINCEQKCGQCLYDDCDPHTGECFDTFCKPGFHPPLCQIPYVYPKYSPRIIDSHMNSATVQFQTDELAGHGKIHLYQLQYKNKDAQHDGWIELQPQKPDGQIITANISGLSAGIEYTIRVIYIDEDGNTYGGDMVPQHNFYTLCTVPTSMKNNIDKFTTTDLIDISWKYTSQRNDCPVTGFTVVLQRKGYTEEHNYFSNEYSNNTVYSNIFQNLRPGTLYDVKVRANTRFGSAPFSTISVKTEDGVPHPVSKLQAKKNGPGKLFISWESPKFTGGIITKYIVSYNCLTIMGCKECTDKIEQIEVEGDQRHVELSGLRHHTQYSVQVAAVAGDRGPFSVVFGLTQEAAPDGAPEEIENSLLSSTNSSVTIQWLPVKDCEFLNGILIGYHYRLLAPNNTLLSKGETRHTKMTLHNLTPRTLYAVHIFAVSSGGMNEDKNLVINATTAATVPEKVQNLTIYKKGRRLFGLRWSQPINTYGEIESFSVSHCQFNNCPKPVTVVVKPKPCIPWPSHFCHTISGLLPNAQYSVSVRARNVLVEQYGTAATVSATTSEGAPETPISLRVTTRNTNSLILEWKPPQIFNGVLRSFLINVEHLDSSDPTNCCTDFPLDQFVVKSEEENYIYEVTYLTPASKYTIGVSAKTIAIGPTTSVTVNTPPEMPKLKHVPELIDENTVKISSEGRFPGLVGTYLLLIFPENGNTRPVIWDPELSRKFQSIIKRNFYIAAELDAEDVLTSAEIEIGEGESPRNGTIGIVEDPELTSKFNIGLALVLEYNGAANVAVVEAPDV